MSLWGIMTRQRGGWGVPSRSTEQYVTDANGRRTGVILSLARYRALIEDLHDLAIVAERRDESPIALDDMKHRLRDEADL
jgi:hypothetical protein